MASESTPTSGTIIILERPEQFHKWMSQTKGSVLEDLWKYFDPDTADTYEEPESVTYDTVHPGAQAFTALTAAEKTHYNSLRNAYQYEMAQYQRIVAEHAKLRAFINRSVSEDNKNYLTEGEPAREWLSNLRSGMKPDDGEMKERTNAKHRLMLGTKFEDWPAGGPAKWLTEWRVLMRDCETWSPARYDDWANDFILVWGEVPGADWVCKTLKDAIRNDELDLWDINSASKELQKAWGEKSSRDGMKVARKGRTYRSVLNVNPQFDGAGPQEEEEEESGPSGQASATTKRSSSRKRAGTGTTQKEGNKRGEKKSKNSCWGCGGGHPHYKCVLISGHNPRSIKVPLERRQAFEERMKDPSFAADVNTIRNADEVKRNRTKRAKAED